MRAVTVSDYGAPPELAEVPAPEPGPGQVLIKLRAAGMNPVDRKLASGEWTPAPAMFPMVLGSMALGLWRRLARG
jgi:NADPH:quinone reductase-like Zn-dependent oxidoreductase